ncbi:MAG: hypothetical protein ACLFVP_08910 [Candidatus Bathyarchaeia archaeon]
MSEDKLAEFLEEGEDWGKIKTNVPGIFVIKLPEYKKSPSRLAVEINPVDASGNTTKRRGLLIKDMYEYDDFKSLITNEKMETLLEMLEDVNPPGVGRDRKGEEVIEI